MHTINNKIKHSCHRIHQRMVVFSLFCLHTIFSYLWQKSNKIIDNWQTRYRIRPRWYEYCTLLTFSGLNWFTVLVSMLSVSVNYCYLTQVLLFYASFSLLYRDFYTWWQNDTKRNRNSVKRARYCCSQKFVHQIP